MGIIAGYIFKYPPSHNNTAKIEPDVIEFVSRLKMDSNVHFNGFMSNPAIGYAAMDCLLLPSYGEGFGNVIIEAGVMEVPVVATNVSGCTGCE